MKIWSSLNLPWGCDFRPIRLAVLKFTRYKQAKCICRRTKKTFLIFLIPGVEVESVESGSKPNLGLMKPVSGNNKFIFILEADPILSREEGVQSHPEPWKMNAWASRWAESPLIPAKWSLCLSLQIQL